MASQGFSFPPPPPPPPPTQQPPSTLENANSYTSSNGFSRRGGQRGGGGHRGRGRGGLSRGGRGGGTYGNNSYRNNNQQGMYGGGGNSAASTQSQLNKASYYPNGSNQIPHSITQSYAPVAQGFSSQAQPYPHTNYGGSYGNANNAGPINVSLTAYPTPSPMGGGATAAPALSLAPPGPTRLSANVMAPPMRWSYDNTQLGGFYPGSTATTKGNLSSYHGSPAQGGYQAKGGGQKRAFSSAFEKSAPHAPRVAAPPAVPSFGVPLPAKPPQPQPAGDGPRKALKKRKRKLNQLGLTPKTDEHESSAEEDDDDVDEESRWASTAGNATGPIQVTFRGHTSTLNSAADIQAWIEERRKKFPTQARIDEKKKAQEEANKQREIQREEARRKQQELKAQREQAKTASKQVVADNPLDAALKAKAKAEKLRKKLLKEERRLQKAEADAERARLVAEASQQQPPPPPAEARSTAENKADQYEAEQDNSRAGVGTPSAPAQASISWDNESNSSNSECSVGEEDSGEDDEDEEGDDVPEEMSSRRDGPERVPPPPREGNTKRGKPCRDFARRGKCPRGTQCRFSHEPRVKQKLPPPPAQGGRRGLYQLLVTQEIQARDRQVMQAIARLGSQGLLEEAQHTQPQSLATVVGNDAAMQ